MSEEQLNEEYIRDNIGGICQDCMYLDEIVPIIRRMLSEAYIKGLEQYKFDLKMDLLTEKVAIPEELANDEQIMDLLEMPSYKELHDRIKLAFKYMDDYNVACDMAKLRKILKGEYEYEKKEQE